MKKFVYILATGLLLNFGQLNAQDDELYDMSLSELLDMEITSASKFGESIKETPATILVITKEDMENRGYESLNQIIADLPGFDIAAAYGNFTQLQYMRGNRTGSFNERTLFMVNGIEHNILYCQAMNIAEDFPISSIERVEVLYGPASAVYGANAFSGIINVITKTATAENSDNVYLHSGLGSENTYYSDMTYIGKQGDIDVSLSFRKYRSDRFDISDKPGYFADEAEDIAKWSDKKIPVGNGAMIGNRAIWGPYAGIYPKYQNIADDHGLLTKVKYKNIEVGFNNLVTIHGNGSEYPYDKTLPTKYWKFNRNNGFIRINKDMNDKLNLSTLVNYNYDGSSPESIWAQGWNSDNTWNSERTAEMLSWKYLSRKMYVFEDFIYKPNDLLTVNGGFKFARGTYQKSYEFGYSHQYHFDPATNFNQVIDTVNDVPYTVMDSLKDLKLYPDLNNPGILPGNNFTENEYGGFLQLKFSLMNNRLFLVTGARYDDNDIYGETFNPRIGGIFNLDNNISFKANFGTAFQAPAPRNMYGSWGGLTVSENLEPEEIMSVDGGIIYTSQNYSVGVTGFYNEVTNSVLQGTNMPDKNIMGAETYINLLYNDLGPVLNRFKTHFNFSWIDARFVDKLYNADSSRETDLIGDIAPIKFNVILDADFLEQFHWNFRVNYVGERETIISNPIEKVDPYMVMNTSLQWKNIFNTKLTLFANVNNILDEEYFHPGMDAASAGEDPSQPSNGWYCSRLPQPGRSYMFGIRTRF